MRLRRRGVILLAIAAVGLSALLVLVVLRGPIAEAATTRVLAWSGVDAELHVAVLDFDRAVVEGLRIGPPDAPAIAARRIEARYNPIGLLRARLGSIAADGLEVRVTVDGAGARLEGLPTGGGGGGGRGGGARRAPEVSVPDGRIYVSTPAGEMLADLVVAGGPEEGWTARMDAYAAVLGSGDAALELESAQLDAAIADDALRVTGDVRLVSVAVGGALAENVSGDVLFQGRYADMSRLAGLVGEGSIGFGLGRATMDPRTAAAWADRLAPRLGGAAGEAADAHIDSLRRLLAEALAELSANADFTLAVADGRVAAAPRDAPAIVASNGSRLSLASASDVGGAIVLDTRAGSISMRDISVTADFGDTLDARAIVTAAAARRENRSVAGEGTLTLAIAPWRAGGLTLAADVQRARIEHDAGRWRILTEAELRADGERWGVSAEDLVARVDLETVFANGVLEVRPREDALQHVQVARVTAAGQVFESVESRVQPLTGGGAFVRVAADGARVESRWLEVSSGVEALGGRWAGVLPAAEFAARFGPGDGRGDGSADGSEGGARGGEIRVYAQAPRLEGRLDSGPVVAQARVIDAALTLAPDSRTRLRFEGLSLGGAALPAEIDDAAGELEATLVDGAPSEGSLALTTAELVDVAERPRLTPVTVSGEGRIEAGVLSAAFTAVDEQSRRIFGADARYDFAATAGDLTIATPTLTFARGFQPYHVAPILQGPFVDVSGSATLSAHLAWDAAGARASGRARLDGLAFGASFGRIEGLSTNFEIADLIAFTTSEPQTIEIGLVDPGLPLTDGELDVELLGGTRMRIAAVRFPFADGVINAEPAVIDWSQTEHRVVLIADSISLNALDEEFNPPNLDVSGRLSGRIPIEAHDRKVEVVDGELVSEEPGELSYTGRAGEGIASQNESTKLAFDALTNYHYDRLVLTLNGDVAGRLYAGVRLEGRNPNLLDGYPINFNLNTSAEFATLMTRGFSGFDLGSAMRAAREDEAAPSQPDEEDSDADSAEPDSGD